MRLLQSLDSRNSPLDPAQRMRPVLDGKRRSPAEPDLPARMESVTGSFAASHLPWQACPGDPWGQNTSRRHIRHDSSCPILKSMPPSPREPLSLPDDANRLLLAAQPILVQFFNFKHLVLGGGTALSARWDHRPSLDIDLFTTTFEVTRRVHRRHAELEAAVASQEGDLEHSCSPDRGEILFPDGGSVSWLHAPRITAPGRSRQFEPDTGLAIETNAEILAKKLYFRIYANYDYLPRDLYDIAWAVTHAPSTTMEAATRIFTAHDRVLLANSFRHLPADTMQQAKGRNRLLDPKDPELARNAIAVIRDYFQRTSSIDPGP